MNEVRLLIASAFVTLLSLFNPPAQADEKTIKADRYAKVKLVEVCLNGRLYVTTFVVEPGRNTKTASTIQVLERYNLDVMSSVKCREVSK